MDEKLAFDVYFSTLVGWQFHPGASRDGAVRLSLEECADMALRMLNIRRQVWPTGQPQ